MDGPRAARFWLEQMEQAAGDARRRFELSSEVLGPEYIDRVGEPLSTRTGVPIIDRELLVRARLELGDAALSLAETGDRVERGSYVAAARSALDARRFRQALPEWEHALLLARLSVLEGRFDASMKTLDRARKRQGGSLTQRQEFELLAADVFGTLAAGPAFATALADFLLEDPRSLREERPNPNDWGAYPPTVLRVALTAGVLGEIGFAADGDKLLADWSAVVGDSRLLAPDCVEEARRVARKLVRSSYPQLGGRRLSDVQCFRPDEHEAAGRDAAKLLENFAPTSSDPALLLCAARLAFASDPRRYEDYAVAKRVRDRILNQRERGIRAAPPTAGQRATDATRGEEIVHYLRRSFSMRTDERQLGTVAEARNMVDEG